MFHRSCKATIKIPKRGEYETELIKRKQAMEKHLGIFGEDMMKGMHLTQNGSNSSSVQVLLWSIGL
jgi:hypothetical protein